MLSAAAYAEDAATVIVPEMKIVLVPHPTQAQAIIDARNAAKRNDFHFLAISSATVECPGIVMDARTFPLMKKYGIQDVEQTEGQFENDAGKKPDTRLVNYAATYNKAILAAHRALTE